MSSQRRILSSRANGALSRGPKTPEGKRRSARNAIRHGLLANCVVLENESQKGFDAVLAEHLARFSAGDGVELGMVEEMVAAFWRLRRIWAIETYLLDEAVAAQEGGEIARIASAFSALAASPQLNLIHRYETRLHRIYQRALRNLHLVRELDVPNEPNPISEHPDPPED